MTMLLATNSPFHFPGATIDTTAGNFDPNHVSRCFRVAYRSGWSDGLQSATPINVALGDVYWVHWRGKFSDNAANNATQARYAEFIGTDGNILARLWDQLNVGEVLHVYGDTGGYTPWNDSFGNRLHTIDMKFDHTGTTIVVSLYIDGILATTNSKNDTAGRSKLGAIVWKSALGQGENLYVSELMVADEDTRNLSLSPLAFNLAGDYNTLAVGSKAEVTDESLATGAVASAVGQKLSMTLSAYGGPSAPSLGGVFINTLGSTRGLTVGDMRPFVRISNTDYFGAGFGYDESIVSRGHYWATNPATGVDWSTTDFAGDIELGVDATA